MLDRKKPQFFAGVKQMLKKPASLVQTVPVNTLFADKIPSQRKEIDGITYFEVGDYQEKYLVYSIGTIKVEANEKFFDEVVKDVHKVTKDIVFFGGAIRNMVQQEGYEVQTAAAAMAMELDARYSVTGRLLIYIKLPSDADVKKFAGPLEGMLADRFDIEEIENFDPFLDVNPANPNGDAVLLTVGEASLLRVVNGNFFGDSKGTKIGKDLNGSDVYVPKILANKSISITGIFGSGKTETAKILAKNLPVPFVIVLDVGGDDLNDVGWGSDVNISSMRFFTDEIIDVFSLRRKKTSVLVNPISELFNILGVKFDEGELTKMVEYTAEQGGTMYDLIEAMRLSGCEVEKLKKFNWKYIRHDTYLHINLRASNLKRTNAAVITAYLTKMANTPGESNYGIVFEEFAELNKVEDESASVNKELAKHILNKRISAIIRFARKSGIWVIVVNHLLKEVLADPVLSQAHEHSAVKIHMDPDGAEDAAMKDLLQANAVGKHYALLKIGPKEKLVEIRLRNSQLATTLAELREKVMMGVPLIPLNGITEETRVKLALLNYREICFNEQDYALLSLNGSKPEVSLIREIMRHVPAVLSNEPSMLYTIRSLDTKKPPFIISLDSKVTLQTMHLVSCLHGSGDLYGYKDDSGVCQKISDLDGLANILKERAGVDIHTVVAQMIAEYEGNPA